MHKTNNQRYIHTHSFTFAVFRSSEPAKRAKFVALVDSVRDSGGQVRPSVHQNMHLYMCMRAEWM
jgi:hypothetical protein